MLASLGQEGDGDRCRGRPVCFGQRRPRGIGNTLHKATWSWFRPFSRRRAFARGRRWSATSTSTASPTRQSVACSKPSQGGTWNGAIEALRAEWVPVWLRVRPDGKLRQTLNLRHRGGRWLPDRLERLDMLFGADRVSEVRRAPESDSIDATSMSETAPARDKCGAGRDALPRVPEEPVRASQGMAGSHARKSPTSLNSQRSQVDAWIRRGLDEGQIIKQGRPVRYRLSPLFGSGA